MIGIRDPRPQGATGRADLLRALAVHPPTSPPDSLTLDVQASGWFGYVRRDDEAPSPAASATILAATPPTVETATKRNDPLHLPFLHMVVERNRLEPEAESTPPDDAAEIGSELSDKDTQARSSFRRTAHEDLVPEARLLPALRRLLGSSRPGSLDMDRLTRQLSAKEFPRYPPRRTVARWHPELVVLLDFSPRLWPYRADMHRLAKRLLKHVGRSGLSLRIIDRGPLGPWSDWLAHQDRDARRLPPWYAWVMPRAGTPVLIVSDLGMLPGPHSEIADTWPAFIEQLQLSRVCPVALVPLGAGQLGVPVPPTLPILRWSPDARPHPTHAHGAAAPQPDGLDDLLAMAAATRRADPPLLRAMRQLNPRAPLNAGLEGALWCHADVEAAWTATVRADAQDAHLERFSTQLPAFHARLHALRRQHHAHLRAVLDHEETLLWAGHSDPAAVDAAAATIESAYAFFRNLAKTLTEQGDDPSGTWPTVAEGIVRRADAAMAKRHARIFNPLLRAVSRTRQAWTNPPSWADTRLLRDLLGPAQPAVSCWLVRDAISGCLVLQTEAPSGRQSPMTDDLPLDAGGVRIRVRGQRTSPWYSVASLPVRLIRLSEPNAVQLETSRERLHVAPVGRPRGALGWGCDGNGLITVQSPPMGMWDMRWDSAALRPVAPSGADPKTAFWSLEADAVSHPETKGAIRFGIEPRFGVYADLSIATEHGRATQRLRWIEPGTFLMGSPKTEPDRVNNEGPQHEVTITKGYWLFDTACTQALWQAVMGANPSCFEGLDRPVENVSWDDVQDFLRRINEMVPGLDLVLPTEAEWEYACRAGTTTPFSFGPTITPEQVNYDGNYPYPGGDKGLYREETVRVASLPANAWGLYEMHGNVWEWCHDGRRSYDDKLAVDPIGPTGAGGSRVLRGGSWFYYARLARSAYRYCYVPGHRFVNYGFRCARVHGGREPAGGPEAREKEKRRGRSKP